MQAVYTMSRIAGIVALCILLSGASGRDDENVRGTKQTYWDDIEENTETKGTKELYKSVKFLSRLIGFGDDQDAQLSRIETFQNLSLAAIARYVVNQAGNRCDIVSTYRTNFYINEVTYRNIFIK